MGLLGTFRGSCRGARDHPAKLMRRYQRQLYVSKSQRTLPVNALACSPVCVHETPSTGWGICFLSATARSLLIFLRRADIRGGLLKSGGMMDDVPRIIGFLKIYLSNGKI